MTLFDIQGTIKEYVLITGKGKPETDKFRANSK